jgi:hypothetical protein
LTPAFARDGTFGKNYSENKKIYLISIVLAILGTILSPIINRGSENRGAFRNFYGWG